MKLRCLIFGHKLPITGSDFWSSSKAEYGQVEVYGTESTGIKHAKIFITCQRCGSKVCVARIKVSRENFAI